MTTMTPEPGSVTGGAAGCRGRARWSRRRWPHSHHAADRGTHAELL